MAIDFVADPFTLFAQWYDNARRADGSTADAMNLATVDLQGRPWSRTVLLKAFDDQGFVFYTNLGSPKARQIEANPFVALCFLWPASRRQVRIQGQAAPVSDSEADAYFATRPRETQIGAWASRQSEPLADRGELQARVARYETTFGSGDVPRPPFWSGYRVRPARMEFWQEAAFRLHDRISYEFENGQWTIQRLYP